MPESRVYINDEAAAADIRRLKEAIMKLDDSLNATKRVLQTASDMKGQTGAAIVEQAGRLETQIQSLKGNLNNTIKSIQNAVNEYHEKDSQLARNFSQY